MHGTIQNQDNMHQHPETLMTCLTIFLYAVHDLTLSNWAAVAAIAAGFTTAALNIKRWFKK